MWSAAAPDLDVSASPGRVLPRRGWRIMLANRRADIFDQEARAVFAPEHVLRDMTDHAIPTRDQDRARVMGARCPVPRRVAHDILDRLAEQLLNLPPQHTRRRRIDEGGAACQINPINAFTGGVENEAVAPIELRQGRLGTLPLGNFGLELGIGVL